MTRSARLDGVGNKIGYQGQFIDNKFPNALMNDSWMAFRVSKILRFGRTRAQVAVDLYNALNANSVETYNQTLVPGTGLWPRPTAILEARFVKFTAVRLLSRLRKEPAT